jgi:hypothetical protein
MAIGYEASDRHRQRKEKDDQTEVLDDLHEDQDAPSGKASVGQWHGDRDHSPPKRGTGQSCRFFQLSADLLNDRSPGLNAERQKIGGAGNDKQSEGAVKGREHPDGCAEEGDVGGTKGDARNQERKETDLGDRGR